MHYDIEGLEPLDHVSVGRHAFCITLHPGWFELVRDSKLTQEWIDRVIGQRGRRWLDCCGFDSMFDIDNCGADADRSKPPGPRAEKSYKPLQDLRVQWGPWGPEHIVVPGNACGLDLDTSGGAMATSGGRVLCPHNIDTWEQKNLLLIVFTFIASSMALLTA